ncbi:IclR family transcriptional regulator [Streptomyces sp. ID03-2B]|uniref:IclR family transcriptional regulator n=1 Tax=Streptomyces caviscabies TaxID=90079 RepID=A0ABW2MDK6_9ACTN|nr:MULTISPECIES: IclR family transcriptional regulator [unclassified Streptomyces]MCL6289145.1 IclR family transcriptional regulator [Streptomyces sp. 43Y-GA-1]MDX3339035.1 IclR family transcriptional regulator [Streptomyces sp. ME02-6979.5a]MDX3506402.1 IclR family transcriptional regulator [Streptomyces sp. ATCC51928]MDX3589879.1 IclR family transcriptional regulator [Streptomyces sp. ID03-2B]MDX5522249.1 IclR family transcriptional regulator [Streptomyces sp. DE06-01C]
MNSVLSHNAGSAQEARRPLPQSMIERMTLIMDLFEGPYDLLTLEDVVLRTRLPRSTAHRILDQLVRMRWLGHSPCGYRLGRRALGLGGRESVHGALRAAAAPVLHELALRTNLVVHLAVLDGAEVYYLDKLGGRSAVTVPSRVGGRAPAHCTALGKAMLARLQPERVDQEHAGLMVRLTARSIGSADQLHRELSAIRVRHGVAIERGEYVPSIGCVATAVPGPGTDGPAGALSLVGKASSPLERLAPMVVAAARDIAAGLRTDADTEQSAARTVNPRSREWSAESVAGFVEGEQGRWW